MAEGTLFRAPHAFDIDERLIKARNKAAILWTASSNMIASIDRKRQFLASLTTDVDGKIVSTDLSDVQEDALFKAHDICVPYLEIKNPQDEPKEKQEKTSSTGTRDDFIKAAMELKKKMLAN